jgi:hypothetical protein
MSVPCWDGSMREIVFWLLLICYLTCRGKRFRRKAHLQPASSQCVSPCSQQRTSMRHATIQTTRRRDGKLHGLLGAADDMVSTREAIKPGTLTNMKLSASLCRHVTVRRSMPGREDAWLGDSSRCDGSCPVTLDGLDRAQHRQASERP